MAGLITPATREQIRAASDVVDVIGACLPLKRAGANFVALCPFHKEKSPSFNVNPHRQIFHCFGCHKGGDVFTFVQEYENITFMEAVRRLAERANIPLDFERGEGQQQVRHLKETLLQIHEQITQRWQNALANDAAAQVARDYLLKRGVTDEAIKLFRLGYAPEAWDDTVNWSKSKGHEPSLVEQAGLILRKEGTDRYYDRFRGRLIFPICDEQGRVIAFSGRILSGDEKTAKYVNSPETPIFTKGKVFFGLDKSKRAILDTGFAIICEGQLDLIACYMAGTRNIVAPQGTAFTADHARILKRYVNEVVLCFDSDRAGQAAVVRVLDSLLASGLAIRVATVPAPHDPDSFIKEFGGTEFQQRIEQAQGFFDYYLSLLCATNDVATDKGRLLVLKSMAEAVLKTGNAVLADTYAQKTAHRLGVATEAVRMEFKKASRQSTPALASEEAMPAGESRAPAPSAHEFMLLKILLQDDEHVGWISSNLDLEWIPNAVARDIVVRRLELHVSHSWQGIPGFVSELQDASARNLVTEVVTRSLISDSTDGTRFRKERKMAEPSKQLPGILTALREASIERKISALTLKISQGLPDAERFQLQREQIQLRQLRGQALSF